MAAPLLIQNGLNSPAKPKGKDLAFYIVPPVLVAAVFAFCALVPNGAAPAKPMAATQPVAKPVATVTKPVVEEPKEVLPTDPNATLPPFAIPAGCENVLEGAELVSCSAEDKDCPAINAIDGSCEDDAHVAVVRPAGGEAAWWKIDASEDHSFSGDTLVVYGGGAKSPAGKLEGGFMVVLELKDNRSMSRTFCEPGFALEGYEAWKLGGMQEVAHVRVIALKKDKPLVLREVQLIGPAEAEAEE